MKNKQELESTIQEMHPRIPIKVKQIVESKNGLFVLVDIISHSSGRTFASYTRSAIYFFDGGNLKKPEYIYETQYHEHWGNNFFGEIHTNIWPEHKIHEIISVDVFTADSSIKYCFHYRDGNNKEKTIEFTKGKKPASA